jgi:hypothetical protein
LSILLYIINHGQTFLSDNPLIGTLLSIFPDLSHKSRSGHLDFISIFFGRISKQTSYLKLLYIDRGVILPRGKIKQRLCILTRTYLTIFKKEMALQRPTDSLYALQSRPAESPSCLVFSISRSYYLSWNHPALVL